MLNDSVPTQGQRSLLFHCFPFLKNYLSFIIESISKPFPGQDGVKNVCKMSQHLALAEGARCGVRGFWPRALTPVAGRGQSFLQSTQLSGQYESSQGKGFALGMKGKDLGWAGA